MFHPAGACPCSSHPTGCCSWLVTNNQCLKSAKVEVFNRYGNKVFEDANYSNQWDGNYKGKPLPDGTYYYVVTYTLVNGKPTYIKGMSPSSGKP